MQRFTARISALGLLVASLGAFLSTASAADDVASRKIFVAPPKNAAWVLTLEVDNPEKTYKIGEQMKIRVTSEKEGYLYLFNQDPNGEIECLYPNNFQSENRIKSGETISVGGEKFKLSAGEPAGKDLIVALVTSQPLKTGKLDELVEAKAARPKRISNRLAKKIVVEALTGDPNLGDTQESVQTVRDKFQQEKPEQYKQKCQEFVMVQLEITTIVGKDKPKPDQDKPNQDKPKPNQDKPNQDKPNQDKPNQDKPSQDKPKPTQEKPNQDKPSQEKPSQDKPNPEKSGKSR